MMDVMQFNGKFGCPVCYHEGEVLQLSEKGRSRVYPFLAAEMRTHDEIYDLGLSAEKMFIASNKKSVDAQKGVKGCSILMKLPQFDIVRAHTVDYMHCVLLGIMKMLLTLWFDVSHAKETWSIRKCLSTINDRLSSLKPPYHISRKPRSLDDVQQWKASEFKSFMLYCSIPVLFGLLPEPYFNHYILLVDSIFVLLGTSITQSDLRRARYMIAQFCSQIEELYGKRFMTFNVHSLGHICNKVEDLGPLWAHSCFFYEDLNGDLRNLFHGSHNVELQIALAISTQIKVCDLSKQLIIGSEEHAFVTHMMKKSQLTKKRTLISDKVYALGGFKHFTPDVPIQDDIEKDYGTMFQYKMFYRILLGNTVITSKKYERAQKRISYAVKFGNEKSGLVSYFVRCLGSIGDKFFAVIQPAKISPSTFSKNKHCLLQHIQKVSGWEPEVVVPVNTIQQLCIFVKSEGTPDAFMVSFPNFVERE